MKKMFIVLFALFLMGGIAHAQTGISLNVGADVLLPMGDNADAYNMGFGGTVRGEYSLPGGKMAVFASTGYLLWSGKSIELLGTTWSTDLTAIPITAGAKYYVAPGIYGLVDFGMYFLSFSVDVSGSSSSTSETKFGYGVGVGYEIPAGPKMIIDVSAKYQSILFESDPFNNIAGRVGVKFAL